MNRSTVKPHAQLAIRFGNRLWHAALAIAVALTGATSSFVFEQAVEHQDLPISPTRRSTDPAGVPAGPAP